MLYFILYHIIQFVILYREGNNALQILFANGTCHIKFWRLRLFIIGKEGEIFLLNRLYVLLFLNGVFIAIIDQPNSHILVGNWGGPFILYLQLHYVWYILWLIFQIDKRVQIYFPLKNRYSIITTVDIIIKNKNR